MTLVQKEIKAVYTWTGNITDMRGPCPEGYHVPSIDEFISLVSMLTTLGLATCTNLKTYLKIPTAGELYFDNPSVNARQHIYLWSSSVSSNNTYRRSLQAYGTNDNISTDTNNFTGYAVPIRPFKDTPVVPDSTWTALYSDKIYHNATLGLISLSSDGTTWITMADKNLGATTVYNSGDTLSEANCGKYYQRGNNYGFPFDGSATTSGTAIDASNYGPGNYYSSSTFITVSNWDSSNNTNLRGGVTGPLTEHKIRPSSRLPSTYQEVEYIQSSGTQHIDTGYKPGKTTKVEIKFNCPSVSVSGWANFYGAFNTYSGSARRAYSLQLQPSTPYVRATVYSNTNQYAIQQSSTSTISANTDYTVIHGNDNWYINGTLQGTFTSVPTYTVPYNMFMFSANNGGSSIVPVSMKLYYFKITDSNTLTRDFVPCYRKSDSVIGLYDLVNNQFYTNSGTGTFTKGPNV